MKRLIALFLFLFCLFGCGESKEVREFDQKNEYFTDASIIANYGKLAREEGFEYYSFFDLRAKEDEYDGYSKTKSYCYGYIDVFDCLTWGKSGFDSRLKDLMRGKSKTYPIILIDYDGAYIEEAYNYFISKGYTNIKAFKHGFFDEEDGYIKQIGFDKLDKCEDCGC